MITLEEIILITGMMLVTFVARYPLLVIVGRIQLPQPIFRALRYVPVAVLTAISVPAMVFQEGEIALSIQNAYLVAGIVAVLIAWRTQNLLWTILGGMGFFLLWRVLMGA